MITKQIEIYQEILKKNELNQSEQLIVRTLISHLNNENILDSTMFATGESITSIYKMYDVMKSYIKSDTQVTKLQDLKQPMKKRIKRKNIINFIIEQITSHNSSLKLKSVRYNDIVFINENNKEINIKVSTSSEEALKSTMEFPTLWGKDSFPRSISSPYDNYQYFIYVLDLKDNNYETLIFSQEQLKELLIKKRISPEDKNNFNNYYFSFEPNESVYDIRSQRINVSYSYTKNRGWELKGD